MIKEAIGVGNTIEEAQNDARKALGIEEDYEVEVEFELIQKPEKKILGLFGGTQAKVKAKIVLGAEVLALDYIKDIIANMGVTDVNVTAAKEDNTIALQLEGEQVGSLIGRRGDTLDALQYLTSLAVNLHSDEYLRVTINTGDYREKREKTLEALGRKLAIKAIKTRRKCSLEPMNPYERRIIHTAVQKVEGAVSWSEGENLNRHVVIGPDPAVRGNQRYQRRDGGRRPYNNRNRGYNNNYRSSNDLNDAQEQQPPKRERLDESGSYGLYGRIDK